MIRNIWLVAVRSLLKQRFYTVLNLGGLALGLTVFLLISLIIFYQSSYDRHFTHIDRLYRIDQTFIWGDAYPTFGSTGPAVAHAVQTYVPGVEKVARVYTVGEYLVSTPSRPEQQAFEEDGVLAVDSAFFDLFTLPVLHGQVGTSFAKPNSAVITASTARRYFGETAVAGQMLKVSNGRKDWLYEIVAVTEDVPENTHFSFNIATSMASYPEVSARSGTWFWSGFVTYALLGKDVTPAAVADLIYHMPEKHAGEAYTSVTSNGRNWHLYLQPVKDIWLHSVNSPNRLGYTGNIMHLYILGAIALMVLILAVVNYMNMATARSFGRAREVGIRKVMGALKGQLLLQFLTESLLLTALATALALLLLEAAIPYFSQLSGSVLSLDILFHSPVRVAALLLLVLTTALVAGAYPAFFMSRFRPVQALKKIHHPRGKGLYLRNGLVVFQFTISITLVVLSLVVHDQLQYLQSKDLGFDKNNLIVVPEVQRLDSVRRASFREALAANPMVQSVGMSTSVPPAVWDGDSFSSEAMPNADVPLSYMNVSKTYLQTLGVEPLYGRVFSEAYEADGTNVLLNETALAALGLERSESVIGQKLIYGRTRFTVIGVLKDFNYRSLDAPIEPLAVFQYGAPISHKNTHHISIRLQPTANNPADVGTFLSALEKEWSAFAPDLPFTYQFTDDMYFQAFAFEQRLGKIFFVFTLLAIGIACMGLLGLAAYVAETRTKEIGIRKVLGATISQLVVLMGRDFALLVAVAFIVSVPLAWWAGGEWLQSYAYRISVGWLPFLYAGAGAMLLAILTVSYQSIRTAMSNPVDVLKDE